MLEKLRANKLSCILFILIIFSMIGLILFNCINSFNNKEKELRGQINVKYSLLDGQIYDYVKTSELLSDEYYTLTKDGTYVKTYIGIKQIYETEKDIDGITIVLDKLNNMGTMIPRSLFQSKSNSSELFLTTMEKLDKEKEVLKDSIHEYNNLVDEYNKHITNPLVIFSNAKQDIRHININWEGLN